MRRPLALLVMVLLLLLTGCASSKVLEVEELAHLRAAPDLHVVHGQPSALSVMTPGGTTAGIVAGALGGAIGGAIVAGIVAVNARSDGQKFVGDYGIADPAAVVKERVVAALVERQVMPATTNVVQSAVDDTGTDALAKTFPSATILAFRTDHWEVKHIGSEYGIVYGASARLVRTRDATELWSVTCRLDGTDFPKVPMADLKADNAALLKTRLQKSAELCAEKLVRQMTGGLVSASAKP